MNRKFWRVGVQDSDYGEESCTLTLSQSTDPLLNMIVHISAHLLRYLEVLPFFVSFRHDTSVIPSKLYWVASFSGVALQYSKATTSVVHWVLRGEGVTRKWPQRLSVLPEVRSGRRARIEPDQNFLFWKVHRVKASIFKFQPAVLEKIKITFKILNYLTTWHKAKLEWL